jgi:hypothetical protein
MGNQPSNKIIDGVQKNYFEDAYELGLRDGIDRCHIGAVRNFLNSGKLDNLKILTRELNYVNKCISARICNKKHIQIIELIEERLNVVSDQV